ncbi:MAG TPA: FtsX-like permease family protein, partial [Methanoregula sp.]|nr:FtsX-like permease family protein [Methanoregula sp.]
LAFISAMVANERQKEIAIIRTLGANRSFILRLMVTESVTMSVLGSLAGIGIALVLLVAFQDLVAFSLKIPFAAPSPVTTLSAAAVTLLITLGICGIASIYPAIRIGNRQLYETIRKGES